jgi:hypothetical protein
LSRQRLEIRRALLPLALAGIGTWLLVGCIYVPTFNHVVRGRDVSRQVGPERSKRPVRVGHATRADVVRVLGPPLRTSYDGHRLAYSWTAVNGLTVWPPLCFTTTAERETRALVLAFDENDALVSYRVTRQMENTLLGESHGPPPMLPWDFFSPDMRPQTRPATRAAEIP